MKVIKDTNWVAPTTKERKDLPQSYFLGANKTFPYKIWKGANKGIVSCSGLKACISRANASGHRAISLKASVMYAKNCK